MISKIQKLLKEKHLDGWLLYDFHGSNPLARRLLNIPSDLLLTRRIFYWIPQEGLPQKIIHKIESEHLEFLPGNTHLYISSKELNDCLGKVLKGYQKIAMEYSRMNAIPRLSLIDAGTFEMVSAHHVDIVSSQDLLLPFTAILSLVEITSHWEASQVLQKSVSQAWQLIAQNMGKVTDYEVQQFLLNTFAEAGCESESAPICAINADSTSPHFVPTAQNAKKIYANDFVLIDLWCKKKGIGKIYADITRVGFVGKPTKRHQEIFEIVQEAQNRAITLLKSQQVTGADVDDACRRYIEEKGYAAFFTHRTGHSIDTQLHGLGPNIDNFETEDRRPLLPGMCFSIEPAIYLPGEFGVRLETDIVIEIDGTISITGGLQEEIESII